MQALRLFLERVTMYFQSNIFLILLPITTFLIFLKRCDAAASWVGDGRITYNVCDASSAFSVTFGSSIEKCFSDCGYHSDCKMIMFYHGMKQCAFFDADLNSFSFNSAGPTCSYLEVTDQNIQGCNSGERFDVSRAVCVVSECDAADTIPKARLLSNTNVVGSSNRYMCEPGFHGIGNPKIHCQTNGIWTTTDFRCQTVFCQAAPGVANATHLLDGNFAPDKRIGTVAKYQCITDHMPIGIPEIICQQNATWSPVNFTCVYAYCQAPQNISNAVLENENRTQLGRRNRYICNVDYIGLGDPEIHCSMNGLWNTLNFSCKYAYCLAPQNISNAVLENENRTEFGGSRTLLGGSNRYICHEDYNGIGNPEIHCRMNGSWSTVNFTCKYAYCLAPNYIANAILENVDRTLLGGSNRYICHDDYNGIGNPEIHCRMNGSWSTVNFTCKYAYCLAPNYIANAILENVDRTLLGGSNRYICHDDYNGIGNPEIHCRMNGLWSTVNFTCKYAYCLAPNYIANAILENVDRTLLGGSNRYICHDDYNGIGNPEIHCRMNGLWSTVNFTCKYKYCLAPNYIANAVLENVDRTLLGGSNRYICHEDYTVIGDPEIHCRMNGSWTSPDFHCVKVCQNPKSISTANLVETDYAHSVSNYTVGTILTYECVDGYQASGKTSFIMCSLNGWRPHFVNCCLDSTVWSKSLCYKTQSFGVFEHSYDGAVQQCSSQGLSLTGTTSRLYKWLIDRNQDVKKFMLYYKRKSEMYADYVSCLSREFNETESEVTSIIGAYYEDAMETSSSFKDSLKCSLHLIDEWAVDQPNGGSDGDCIIGKLESDAYLYFDINCDTGHPASFDEVGFACVYSLPAV